MVQILDLIYIGLRVTKCEIELVKVWKISVGPLNWYKITPKNVKCAIELDSQRGL